MTAVNTVKMKKEWMQASSSGSDSDAEDFLPLKRAVHQRSKRIEEEEEEEESSVKAPSKRAKKATSAGIAACIVQACSGACLLADSMS